MSNHSILNSPIKMNFLSRYVPNKVITNPVITNLINPTCQILRFQTSMYTGCQTDAAEKTSLEPVPRIIHLPNLKPSGQPPNQPTYHSRPLTNRFGGDIKLENVKSIRYISINERSRCNKTSEMERRWFSSGYTVVCQRKDTV